MHRYRRLDLVAAALEVRTTKLVIFLQGVALVTTLAGCARSIPEAAHKRPAAPVDFPTLEEVTAGFGAAVRADVERLRAATVLYHDLKTAQAAGYPVATPACVADSTMGGMGRHYFDRAVFDGALNIEHPEMLIYAPTVAGKPDQLVGVEYVIPFRVLPSTEKPPRLFGQELRRHEEFKYWYLHVWAWKKNSAGLFSDWDPGIRC